MVQLRAWLAICRNTFGCEFKELKGGNVGCKCAKVRNCRNVYSVRCESAELTHCRTIYSASCERAEFTVCITV